MKKKYYMQDHQSLQPSSFLGWLAGLFSFGLSKGKKKYCPLWSATQTPLSKKNTDFVIRLMSSPATPPTPSMVAARERLNTIKNNAI